MLLYKKLLLMTFGTALVLEACMILFTQILIENLDTNTV